MNIRNSRIAAAIAAACPGLPVHDSGRRIILPVDYHARAMERKDTAPEPSAADIKNFEDLKGVFLKNHKSLKEFVEKANKELETAGAVSAESKSAIASITTTLNTIGERLDKAEAKANRMGEPSLIVKSLGTQFIENPAYPEMSEMKGRGKMRMDIKAITNAAGQNQPLVPDQRVPGIQMLPNRTLRIRDLLPTGRTTSNLVQYVKENVFTNNAGPQAGGSPTVAGENQLKNESDITFTLANAPVVTIAHFILVSKQVLDDAPMLQSYIDQRLIYGLKLEEEDEILNGDGQVGTLDGLMHNATGYSRAMTGTRLDILRRSITQLTLSEFDAEAFVLNPADWEEIELIKDTQGRYIIGNPAAELGPRLWGKPVVSTNSMTQGQFLTANFSQAAMLWDREQASVELSREDSDNFRRNMVTILAEERVALTVFRPTALIKGVFPS